MTKWKTTFLIDEADEAFKNDDLRAVVNSGWTRGMGIVRCDPETHEPRLYETFAPKVIVMKGKRLPDTTLSRSVVIELRRKLADETVKDFDHLDDDDLARLRSQLLRWATDNIDALRVARPETIPGFDNRLRQNWLPLLAIAELAGGEAKQKAWAAAKDIEGTKEGDDASLSIQLLSDIRDIFQAERASRRDLADDIGQRITSKELVERLTADADKRWAEYYRGKPLSQTQLARLLKSYLIFSRNIRTEGDSIPKGYLRSQFEDAWKRYLPAEPTSEPLRRYSDEKSKTYDDFRAATEEPRSGSETAPNPLDDQLRSGVAAPKPLDEDGKQNSSGFRFKYLPPEYFCRSGDEPPRPS